MNEQNSLLGKVGSVGIDIKLDTADVVKLGLMFLIVLIVFAFVFVLIQKALLKAG